VGSGGGGGGGGCFRVNWCLLVVLRVSESKQSLFSIDASPSLPDAILLRNRTEQNRVAKFRLIDYHIFGSLRSVQIFSYPFSYF
jgi:hypothetical protein